MSERASGLRLMTSKEALIADWQRGAEVGARVLKAIFGTNDEVRPWAELMQGLSLPDNRAAGSLLDHTFGNMIRFRANWGRMLAVWCAICAVRHPIGAILVAAIGSLSFHALIVRRGVVHLTLRNGRSVTLMFPRLHVALAAGSLFAILLVGRLTFLLATLLPPLLLSAVHAVLYSPPGRALVESRLTQIQVELRAALRGEEVSVEELETGAAEEEPPTRSDELAKRVEQIRQKYRPPGAKRNMD